MFLSTEDWNFIKRGLVIPPFLPAAELHDLPRALNAGEVPSSVTNRILGSHGEDFSALGEVVKTIFFFKKRYHPLSHCITLQPLLESTLINAAEAFKM